MKQFTLTYGEMLRVRDILTTIPAGCQVILYRDILKHNLVVEYTSENCRGHRAQVVV